MIEPIKRHLLSSIREEGGSGGGQPQPASKLPRKSGLEIATEQPRFDPEELRTLRRIYPDDEVPSIAAHLAINDPITDAAGDRYMRFVSRAKVVRDCASSISVFGFAVSALDKTAAGSSSGLGMGIAFAALAVGIFVLERVRRRLWKEELQEAKATLKDKITQHLMTTKAESGAAQGAPAR